jgi:hypothetical protein
MTTGAARPGTAGDPPPRRGRAGGRKRPPTEPCLNCGDPTPGRFCPSCGQRKVNVRASIGAVLEDVVKDELVLNAALPRTVGALLFRPGHLTAEYIRGRVVRYIPPLRLYLVSSVLCFLVVSFIGLRALERATLRPSLPADIDAARAVLLERQGELQAVDTTGLPAAARAALRQSLASTAAQLAALDDTTGGNDPLAGLRMQGTPGRVAPLPPGSMQPWAQNLRFRSTWSFLDRAMARKVGQIGHLPPRDALSVVAADLLRFAPHMVFLLLPVFALLLKLLYIRRDRFYAEHVVFALHVHAFFFVMFLVMLLPVRGRIDALFVLWMIAYVWLAMKRVYGQGWFRTTAKWAVLGFSYGVVLAFGLIGLMAATLVLT